MKLRELLFLVLSTALFGACSHGEMQRRLAEVDSLTDANYDSALVLLARMDSLPMRRADRMYLELLRGKAMNKAAVPFTTDSVMRRVVRYYDRRGSANRRMLAHYVLGCAYRDMKSAPRALEEYQKAVSLADTARADCDLSTLMRVHSQMAGLYLQLRLPDLQNEEFIIAKNLAWRIGDTISALAISNSLCYYLYEKEEHEKCIAATDSLYREAVRMGRQNVGEVLCINAIKSAHALGRYEEMRKYLDIYARSTILKSDTRM
nr:hypothetical protein [Bacteroidaceae bacterium]